MLNFLTLEFMQRALLAGLILAPLLAVLGSFMTLRKMSFFADGIAHASLFGIALAILTGASPFYGALIIALVFACVIYLLEHYGSLSSDGVIGIIFTTGLALGIVMISLQPGYQPDLISFLFGNILAIRWSDVWLISGISILLLLLVYTNFRSLLLTSLSKDLAWVSGVSIKNNTLLFYIMLSLAVVLGVRLLGIILVTALLITPAMTSKLCTSSFKQYLIGSVIFSLISVTGGLILSYYLDLPTGATIVLFSTFCFISTLFITKITFLYRK